MIENNKNNYNQLYKNMGDSEYTISPTKVNKLCVVLFVYV
jgi:hypothetical protein